MIDRALEMLRACRSGESHFPPTILFNEGWLLRIVLDWFSSHRDVEHALRFHPGATWYSEAQLPTPFAPRRRGDPLGEARTHADGVIGHVEVGAKNKADLQLAPGATQFIVLEAKIFSELSANVSHAPGYDQVARNVACIAQVLAQANRPPDDKIELAFSVVAPKENILGFGNLVSRESILKKVSKRVADYGPEFPHGAWLTKWFGPVLERLQVLCITWEEVVDFVGKKDGRDGQALKEFYEQCRAVNGPAGERE
jgi:hypothetical protein